MAAERRPELSYRPYGRCDFERFDNVALNQASIGAASIGKVQVDCKFLFTKSQWGVLHAAENPAGIVYLDLTFSQPIGHRLRNVTISVTLDDDTYNPQNQHQSPNGGPIVPVQFCHYGPKQLSGQARHALKTQRRSLMPSVNVMGVAGAGGIGHESEKHLIQECRWRFSSQLLPDPKSKRNVWAYKILRWELTENELEAQTSHSNTIHTAFSFQHDGQPFYMKVDVDGRLDKLSSGLKNSVKSTLDKMKFSSKSKDARCATTLVNFGGRDKFRKPLDELARSLPLAMEEENMRAVPIQIHNPHAPVFQGASTSAVLGATNPAISRPDDTNALWNRIQHSPGCQSCPAHEQPLQDFGTMTSEQTSSRTQPTLQNLSKAFEELTRPKLPTLTTGHFRRSLETSGLSMEDNAAVQSHIATITPELEKDRQEEASETSSTTLFDKEHDPIDLNLTRTSSTQHTVDTEALYMVLRLPGFLRLLQFITSLLHLCGMNLSNPSNLSASKDDNKRLVDVSEGKESQGCKIEPSCDQLPKHIERNG